MTCTGPEVHLGRTLDSAPLVIRRMLPRESCKENVAGLDAVIEHFFTTVFTCTMTDMHFRSESNSRTWSLRNLDTLKEKQLK